MGGVLNGIKGSALFSCRRPRRKHFRCGRLSAYYPANLIAELGKQLLIRGKRNRKIALTEDGMRLRKRAEEIIALADKTEAEFLAEGQDISGDVYIGCGESDAMRIIARTAVRLKEDYPDIRFHLYSGFYYRGRY